MATYAQLDLSGALQRGTSHLLRRRNEVVSTKNAVYNHKIGSARRRLGYEKVAQTIQLNKDSLGAFVYQYGTNNKIIAGINNVSDTNATLRFLDGDSWKNVLSDAAANTRFQMINDLDQLYVAGASDNNVYLPLTNIDYTLTPSTTRNVYTAPASKFIAEYNGRLYAINCFINGKYYPDRFYKSSPSLGFITTLQTDQSGLLVQLRADSVRYIKVGMQVDIYGAGTEAKKTTLTVTSVDKKNNRFSFTEMFINVADNDEIWLSGTKGTLSRFWNTDYPTPETATDWDRVKPGKEAKPEFTGWGKNNNRLLLYTLNSTLKTDSQNLMTVSDIIGCVSHETIKNINGWTLWLHTTGIWGYNDGTGNLKRLSRAIEPYIKAINQSNLSKASAVVVGTVYKVAVGELRRIEEDNTTSTSTSSTSTSSTSSSTSSTSTSSTSTSSTQTTTITTSTSSTSASTISTSTSSTSTSTTSSISTRKVARFCYDFDLNAWWIEEHTRDIRFQFNHNMHGYTKPYFTDNEGHLFRDETGNLDHTQSIPLDIEIGRDTFGTGQRKVYQSVIVDSEDARGAILKYSIDGGAWLDLGEITQKIQAFGFPQGRQSPEGRDINYRFVHNGKGAPAMINGLTTYFDVTETVVNGT